MKPLLAVRNVVCTVRCCVSPPVDDADDEVDGLPPHSEKPSGCEDDDEEVNEGDHEEHENETGDLPGEQERSAS